MCSVAFSNCALNQSVELQVPEPQLFGPEAPARRAIPYTLHSNLRIDLKRKPLAQAECGREERLELVELLRIAAQMRVYERADGFCNSTELGRDARLRAICDASLTSSMISPFKTAIFWL